MTIPRIGLVAGRSIAAVVLAVAWLGGCVSPEKVNHPIGPVPPPPPGEPSAPDYLDTSQCEGRPVETIEDNYPDGSLGRRREVVRLDDGTHVSHGLTTTFWEGEWEGEVRKKLELEFVCGVRHGLKRAWHQNGDKWQEGHNINGKGHGEWTTWAPGGVLVQRFTLDHGAWHGPFTWWYLNGQKRMEVEWVNGRKQGPEIYWDEDGNEVKRIEYVDGVPQPTSGPQPE